MIRRVVLAGEAKVFSTGAGANASLKRAWLSLESRSPRGQTRNLSDLPMARLKLG
jgi:hypothetical protein